MDRGEGDALGTKVATPHSVTSGGAHIGTDGTFSVVDRDHMLKQIFSCRMATYRERQHPRKEKLGEG